MSPVVRSSFRAGRTMILSLVVIVLALLVMWGASAWLTKRHNDRLATDSGGVVELGSAERIVTQFDRGGGAPIHFPDVSGNTERAVYLIHAGGSSDKGWTVFLAQVPGEDSSCQWQWNSETERLDASCDPDRHADVTDTELEQYPVTVVEGKLQVDLRSRIPPQEATPSTAP